MMLIGLNKSAGLNQADLLQASFVNQSQGRNMRAAQNKNTNLESKIILNNVDYLSQTTIQKMLLRLLQDAKISEAKLSKYLDITPAELLTLIEARASLELVKKISLPLVNRYCSTKFTNQ